MEVEILCRKGRKIVALLLVTMMVLTMTACQDDSADHYDDGDNGEEINREDLVGDEDDEKAFSFPIRAETDPYTTVKTTTHKTIKCDEDQIMAYLAELQVINPESILLIASYKDLEHLCRRIAGNLDSIDSYMQTCTPLPQDHLYMQLISGLRVLSNKLCLETDYQKDFRHNLACYHELHNEYMDCEGPADWTENMQPTELCEEYKTIADCYYTKTAMLCGIKAAKTMKELVVRVVNAIVETHCPDLRKNPIVRDAMPEFVFSEPSASRKLVPNPNLSLILVAFHIVLTLPVRQILYYTCTFSR